jgi:hypothetical protein
MSDLSLKREINPIQLKESLGRRFTVTLHRPDFTVKVNGTGIAVEDCLPTFAFSVGSSSAPVVETVDVGGTPRQVRSWAGFVATADWPQDQAGVGIYAHGKIAQDRPFTFGMKGREIYARYLYGVIEADWLDEFADDVVSTDRTSVDWNYPDLEAFYAWGRGKVNAWVSEYQAHKKAKTREENKSRLTRANIPKLTESETDSLLQLLEEVTPTLGNDEQTKDVLTKSLADAWIHKPHRELAKSLWNSLKSEAEAGGTQAFASVVDRLADHMVPEALSLAVTFAQRAYALTVLYELVHKGKEPDLQKLIERFPWILQPSMELLTANQALSTAVREAESSGAMKEMLGDPPQDDSALKPDFVFLSDSPDCHKIVVVELKSPRVPLTRQNREQLRRYLVYLKAIYPSASVTGFLVGTHNGGLDDELSGGIKIKPWIEVFKESRAGHIELLAALLGAASPSPTDARVMQVTEFGGPATTELLRRMADTDERLRDLFSIHGDFWGNTPAPLLPAG